MLGHPAACHVNLYDPRRRHLVCCAMADLLFLVFGTSSPTRSQSSTEFAFYCSGFLVELSFE